MSGKIIGDGEVDVHVVDAEGNKYLLYTNRIPDGMNSITGFASAKVGKEKRIKTKKLNEKNSSNKKSKTPVHSSTKVAVSIPSTENVERGNQSVGSDDEIYSMIDRDIIDGAGLTRADGVFGLQKKLLKRLL